MNRKTVILFAILALVVIAVAALPGQHSNALYWAAAVTVVRRKLGFTSNRKVRTFTITGGNGDTLDTRLKVIEAAHVDPNVANAPTVLTESTVGGYKTITFTSGGPYTAAKLTVIGS